VDIAGGRVGGLTIGRPVPSSGASESATKPSIRGGPHRGELFRREFEMQLDQSARTKQLLPRFIRSDILGLKDQARAPS
jgi:hypothetical protein